MIRKPLIRRVLWDHHGVRTQPRTRRLPRTVLAASALFCCLAAATQAWAVEPFVDVTPRYLPAIRPGTHVTDRVEGWSHLLMVCEPTLAAGDVDDMDNFSRGMAGRFNLTLAADVRRNKDGSYYLRSLGCGFAVKQEDGYTLVSADDSPGVDLGFIERIILQRNEAVMKDVIQFARSLQMAIFDAKTFVLSDGEHRDWYVRHAVLVDPTTGHVSQVLWLVAPQQGQSDHLRIPKNTVRVVPVGIVEKRMIHVDKRHFALGLPTDRAFAMMELPRGKDVQVPEDLLPLFTAHRLTAEQVPQLQAALEKIVATAR